MYITDVFPISDIVLTASTRKNGNNLPTLPNSILKEKNPLKEIKKLLKTLQLVKIYDSLDIPEFVLRHCCHYYGEQLILDPLIDLFLYSTHLTGTPGIFLPNVLFLFRKTKTQEYLANISAIGSVGEGIAGFIMNDYFKGQLIFRTRLRGPDIEIELPGGFCGYVEAKATMQPKTNLIPLLANAVAQTIKWLHAPLAAQTVNRNTTRIYAIASNLSAMPYVTCEFIELCLE